MKDLMIRKAEPEDVNALFGMIELFNGEGSTERSRMQILLGDQSQGEIVLIARLGGEYAGFICGQAYRSICYRDNTYEITELYVDEKARRQGVAGALIRAMEDEFMRRGTGEIRIYTGSKNIAAQALYKAMGYKGSTEMMFKKDLSITI